MRQKLKELKIGCIKFLLLIPLHQLTASQVSCAITYGEEQRNDSLEIFAGVFIMNLYH